MTRRARPVLISTDLDRTLIFSPRASAMLGGALPATKVEDTGRDTDAELGVAAARALAALPAHVVVCPATSRDLARLLRLRLPFAARYAVAANGGVVLAGGAPDPVWAVRTAALLTSAASAAEVRPVLSGTRACAGAGARAAPAAAAAPPWLIRAGEPDDLCCLAIVDRSRYADGELAAIASRCAELGWHVSLTGRKLYAFPAGVGKEQAVAYVAQCIERDTGAVPFRLAAGDSEHDRAMLADADLAWIPAGSELACGQTAASGLDLGRAKLTARPGHAAAAEITSDWREFGMDCGL